LHERLFNLQENLILANEIVKQNYTFPFTPSETNPLGKALIELKESLILSKEQAKENIFKTEGLATLGETLRENADNIEILSRETLNDLIKLLDAQQGIFYLTDKNADYLNVVASYAVLQVQKNTIAISEGLIGQAFYANKMIHLKKLPEDYIPISSALGKSHEANLVIVPIRNAGKAIGVVELFALQPFKQVHLEFLETISEIIGSVIDSTRSHQITAQAENQKA